MARILLVEDEPDVLLIFEEILLDAGHQVDTAATFRAAAALLASRHYDLVASDGRLPDGTGIGVADDAKARGTRTLIITGYLEGLRDSYPNLGDYPMLRKPVTTRTLQAVGRPLPAARYQLAMEGVQR